MPTVEPGWTPLLARRTTRSSRRRTAASPGRSATRWPPSWAPTRSISSVDAANIGVTRHYATRQDLLAEVGEARIWAGLHYRFSTETGLRLAQRVVNLNLSRNFRPVD